MSNNKIFPARRVFPVIELIRELNREAAEVPGAEEQVVVDKAILEVLYAAALELERNTPTLVVGLHTHDSGVSPYVFAVDPFIPFGQDDFQEYLEETFEPWKDEYLDVETNIDAIEIRALDAHQSTAAEPASVVHALQARGAIEVKEDADQAGRFCYFLRGEGSEISYDDPSEARSAALSAALAHVREHQDIGAVAWGSMSEQQKREAIEATFGEDEEEQQAQRFLNHYKCPNCSSEWSDEWECQVDDECGECGTRHISPYASEDA